MRHLHTLAWLALASCASIGLIPVLAFAFATLGLPRELDGLVTPLAIVLAFALAWVVWNAPPPNP